jgi:hypothetical protein
MVEKPSKTVVVETRKVERSSQERSKPEPYELKLSPCAYQTAAEIEAYYRGASIGAVAVVRQTQNHMLVYAVTEIEGVNPARGRTYVKQYGAFYMKSGANCFHPKGQTTLVVPTADVLKWAAEHPRGKFHYTIYPPEMRLFGK